MGVSPNKCVLVISTVAFIWFTLCVGQLSMTVTNTSDIGCINRKGLFVSAWELSAHD